MAEKVTPYYAADGVATRFYDILTEADRSIAADVDIYAGLATGRGEVLELGAGTGRVAIALAERGFAVTGLDLAPAMLAQAEAKRAELALEVQNRLRFVQGDLTALALGRRFDAVFATYFTLAHLPPASSWAKAMKGMARHLAPEGLIAVHLPLAERMADPPPSPDAPVLHLPVNTGGAVTLHVAGKTWDPVKHRMELLLDYRLAEPGQPERCSRERLTYYAADPAPFAARAGLRSAGAPIAVGTSGFIHLFEHAESANGAIDGD
jgi:SAM-dependent methyltransferase